MSYHGPRVPCTSGCTKSFKSEGGLKCHNSKKHVDKPFSLTDGHQIRSFTTEKARDEYATNLSGEKNHTLNEAVHQKFVRHNLEMDELAAFMAGTSLGGRKQ